MVLPLLNAASRLTLVRLSLTGSTVSPVDLSSLLEVRGNNSISKPILDRFSLNMLKADKRNEVRLKLFHSNNSSRLSLWCEVLHQQRSGQLSVRTGRSKRKTSGPQTLETVFFLF